MSTTTSKYIELIGALQLSIGRIHDLPVHWSDKASEHQVRVLNQLITAGLTDKSRQMRLAVIQRLASLQSLASTKDLLKWEAGVLISILKDFKTWELSDNGRFLIQYTELILSQAAEGGPLQPA